MRPSLQITDVHWRQKVRLQQMYQETDCPRTRIRVQMVLLSVEEYSVSKIASITRQSDDTVRRWLHRFREQGSRGLLEEIRSGRPANITPAIENFLLTCLKQSPRKFGISRPTWTTATLAAAVEKKFKIEVSDKCVRQHLQRLEIVC